MNETSIFIKCPLEYSHWERGADQASGGKAVAVIEKESLAILSLSGQDLVISLRDIQDIILLNYRVSLNLMSGEQIQLERLGYRYEDFVRILHQCRNEIILKDMLAQEGVLMKDVAADVEYLDGNGSVVFKGKAWLRLYETSLAILPEQGEIFRLPFGYLEKVLKVEYRVVITGEMGEKIFVSKLGTLMDPWHILLMDTLNNLAAKTQTFLKELLPGVDGVSIRQLANQMKDGRAISKPRVDAISPSLWMEMEKVLKTTPIGPRYQYLIAKGNKDRVCLGFKRGLMGDLTGDTVWFLVPFFNSVAGTPGNAVVMEVARLPEPTDPNMVQGRAAEKDENSEGYATYVFRIFNRQDYHGSPQMDDLEQGVDAFIQTFNRHLLDINFRRQPIYLPESRFVEPVYQKYQYSLKRSPAMQMLRQHFIGRVIHHSEAQWQADIESALAFNVSTLDNDLKWEKGG